MLKPLCMMHREVIFITKHIMKNFVNKLQNITKSLWITIKHIE